MKNSACGAIKKGQEFTVKAISAWCNCGTLLDVGLKYPVQNAMAECTVCKKIRISDGIRYKREDLFGPLDQDISELTEILEQSNTIQNV